MAEKLENDAKVCQIQNSPFASFTELMEHIKRIHKIPFLSICFECEFLSVCEDEFRKHQQRDCLKNNQKCPAHDCDLEIEILFPSAATFKRLIGTNLSTVVTYVSLMMLGSKLEESLITILLKIIIFTLTIVVFVGRNMTQQRTFTDMREIVMY